MNKDNDIQLEPNLSEIGKILGYREFVSLTVNEFLLILSYDNAFPKQIIL